MKNKNIMIISFLTLILTIAIAFVSSNYILKEKDNYVYASGPISLKNGGAIALMIENDEGNYVESNDSTWPGEGYQYNAGLSKCENGSELVYDSKTNSVILTTSISDKCYVYFDKYAEPSYHADCTGNSLACVIAKKSTDGANNLYYHDGKGDYTNSNLEAGDKSYRYAGASADVKNYVCLGSTAETCPADNLYRIIGVFPTSEAATEYQVKLIKNTSIGTYQWSGSSDNNSDNWEDSTLRTDILNNETGTYWQSLGTDASKVADHNWVISGGPSGINTDSNAQIAYNYEVAKECSTCTGKETYATLPNKVGLMYVSDYMYASSPSGWNVTGSGYNSNEANNWLVSGSDEWIISRKSGNTDSSKTAFVVSGLGGVLVSYVCAARFVVRPTIYLESTVNYASGSGSDADPIRTS